FGRSRARALSAAVTYPAISSSPAMSTAQAAVRVASGRRTGAARRTSRLPTFINPASLMLVCAVALTLLGVTILFSASSAFRSDPYFFVRRQVMWLGVALVCGFLASRVNLERLRRFTWWFVGLLFVGLGVTL